MPDFRPLTEWTLRQVKAATDDAPVAYLVLCPREGTNYPQRGRVEVSGVPMPALESKLAETLTDIAESSEAEDRPCSRLRVRLYGPKGLEERATRTFLVDREAESSASAPGGREGETVALMREARLALADSYQTIRAQTAAAFSLADTAMKAHGELLNERADLRGALIVSEQTHTTFLDKCLPLIEQVTPLILAKLAG